LLHPRSLDTLAVSLYVALISGCGRHEFGVLCEGPEECWGVGDEHDAWWIKRAWSPAVEVAALLAAMAVRGYSVVGGVVGGLLGFRGIIHNPVCMYLLLHIIVRP
jgi:hypothetical protein